MRNGIGTKVFLNGKKYEGDWYNSEKNGMGLMNWPDGNI